MTPPPSSSYGGAAPGGGVFLCSRRPFSVKLDNPDLSLPFIGQIQHCISVAYRLKRLKLCTRQSRLLDL